MINLIDNAIYDKICKMAGDNKLIYIQLEILIYLISNVEATKMPNIL